MSLRIRTTSGSAKIVLQAHDVVFAEIIASLNLDKDQIFVAGVFNAVGGADSDIDRLAGADSDLTTVECDTSCSFDDEPVLGALRVFLVTESLTRQHLDTFNLERACLFEHGVTAPWSPIEFSHLADPLLSSPGNLTQKRPRITWIRGRNVLANGAF
jgi:hypothetical protein